eukprot:2015193-Prymnesium_polylepis.1
MSGSYSPRRKEFLLPSRSIAKRRPRCRPPSPSVRHNRRRQSASPPYWRGAPGGISSRSIASRVLATSAGLVKTQASAGPTAEKVMPRATSRRSLAIRDGVRARQQRGRGPRLERAAAA